MAVHEQVKVHEHVHVKVNVDLGDWLSCVREAVRSQAVRSSR
jgi:hypothetical protein